MDAFGSAVPIMVNEVGTVALLAGLVIVGGLSTDIEIISDAAEVPPLVV